MMQIDILGQARDLRTDTDVIYAKLSIPDYLSLVGEHFDQFEIQRRREKHKAYKRLEQDVRNGALLPSITLAIKLDLVDKFLPLARDENFEALREGLSVPGQVHILDGLQRTYILHDLFNSGVEFKEGQTVLIEFWLERELRNLIYRIIVLNAGQKPMSMRHQVELLFTTVKTRLESEIPDLEIYMERDEARRNRPRKFALDRLATAYQCYVTKTPEVKRDNLVAQKLVEDDLLSSTEEELSEQFEKYKAHLMFYADLDVEVYRVYERDTSWLGSENVMNSFFAALADFGSSSSRQERIDAACRRMLVSLRQSNTGDDPLGRGTLQEIIQGFDTRKVNVGFATRKLLTAGFKEFFRDEGETPLQRCWLNEAP
jgi:hypothetical protein